MRKTGPTMTRIYLLMVLLLSLAYTTRASAEAIPAVDSAPRANQEVPMEASRKAASLSSPSAEDDIVFEWEEQPAEAQILDTPKPTPAFIKGRSDIPDRPLSEVGPPTFPAQYPSCRKCQKNYPSISSCMEASSVFANATSIFNDPFDYIAVIKCACTDTFQAVYPQCVDCFQHTNQCWYLGTDPEGTGAPQLITNIRQICGFGSALLGGVAGANHMNNSYNVSVVPTYTDVSTTAAGYLDQAAGPIFPSSAGRIPLDQSALHAFLVISLLSLGLITVL